MKFYDELDVVGQIESTTFCNNNQILCKTTYSHEYMGINISIHIPNHKYISISKGARGIISYHQLNAIVWPEEKLNCHLNSCCYTRKLKYSIWVWFWMRMGSLSKYIIIVENYFFFFDIIKSKSKNIPKGNTIGNWTRLYH